MDIEARSETQGNYDSGRKLGTHERLLYLYSQQHPRHFCIAAEVIGQLRPVELQTALQNLQARHLPLCLFIHDAEDGPQFGVHRHPIPLRLKNDSSANWQELVEEELRTPFPTDLGPLMRLTLLSNAYPRDRQTLILTFHHALGDGLSAIAVLNDLIALLNGRDLPALPHQPPIEALLMASPPDAILRDNAPPAGIPSMQTLREISKRPLWRDFATDRPRVDAHRFTTPETDTIVRACRSHSATVQGALCAAVAISLSGIKRQETLRVVSPINVRQRAGVERHDIGLFLAIGSVSVNVDRDTDFWALARQINDDLATARSEKGVVEWLEQLDRMIPPKADSDAACGLIGALGYDSVVSNLGIIQPDEQVDDELRLSAIWGPCVVGRLNEEYTIGAATSDGRLHLTQTGPAHARALLGHIRSHILMACETNT
ncbi:condensation domain-containing protein [Rhizobium johnstonii]|uniref:condensation domain-containing protein n=1 Tax=Rhizobium johnstonii TaxID=3019933 RepID=UPI003F9801A7